MPKPQRPKLPVPSDARRKRLLVVAVIAACLLVTLVLVLATLPASGGSTAQQPALEVTDSTGEDATDRALFQASARTQDVGDPTLAPSGLGLPTARKNWTVMVYMVGSNLESRFGNATKDLDEMAAAGVDYSQSNLVVYAGGSRRWQSDLPSDRNSLIDLARDAGERVVASTTGKADMGSAATLAEFVNYATEHYPAEHYALVLWDHGGGPLWGYGADENYKNDTLLLSEMRTAMDSTRFGQGDAKLDLVGFDACLMGSVEVASLWSAYTDVLVASEELEPGDGWDYSALATLNSAPDARDLATSIVDAYGTHYAAAASETSNPDVTLAAYDLTRVGDVTSALESLAGELDGLLAQGGYAWLAQARGDARALGLSSTTSRGEAYDLVDLRSLADGLKGDLPWESSELADAVDGLVIAGTTNVDGLGGLSVYFPGDNAELYQASGEEVLGDIAVSGAYRSFCNDYASDWLGDSPADWTLAGITDAGDHYELRLTDEQLENLSGAYYTVLMQTEESGSYTPVLENVRVRPDDDGVVSVPKDPSVVCAFTDESLDATECVFAQTEVHDGVEVYRSLRTYLGTGQDFMDVGAYSDSSINAGVTVSVADGSQDVQLRSVSATSGALSLSGRQTVDVSDYDCLGINYGESSTPATDSDGSMLPWTEWPGVESYWWINLPLESSFRFGLVPVSGIGGSGGEHVCQLTLADVNGGTHASELLELARDGSSETTVATEAGSLTFEVEDDHAELVGYEGSDARLEVPASVDGVPVTVVRSLLDANNTVTSVVLPDSVTTVDSGAMSWASSLESIKLGSGLRQVGHAAFLGCKALTAIDLPDSVTSIGGAAFAGTGLITAEIPSSLQHLGKGAFSNIQTLTAFEQKGENEVTSVRDGVLFSADGTELLGYPAGREGGYDIPQGTERVGYAAFAGCDVTSVSMPEGLASIGNCAFLGCCELTAIDLPHSLVSIGAEAFDLTSRLAHLVDSEFEYPVIDAVHIGPAVSHIGGGAFQNAKIERFEVSEENPLFSGPGGFLCNKAGDNIVAVPEGVRGVVAVPDGVTTLDYCVFSYLDDDFYGEQTDVVLPDSVYRMDARAFGTWTTSIEEAGGIAGSTGGDDKVSPVVLHASSGSAAEAYAERYGLPCDNVTDPSRLAYSEETIEVGPASLLFRVYDDRATLVKIGRAEGSDGTDATGAAATGTDAVDGAGGSADATPTDNADGDTDGGTDGRLVIPAEVDSRPVTQLGFGSNELLIPQELDTLVIPASVTSITSRALARRDSIELAEGNASYRLVDDTLLTADGRLLVRHTGDAESYDVPEGVEEIGAYAFNGCEALASVSMPASLQSIGSYAFRGCTSLIELSFSDGVESIGAYAFSRCPLRNLDLPESLRTVGMYAFADNPEGFESLTLPDGLESVGRAAFGSSYGDLAPLDVGTLEIGSQLAVGDSWGERVPFAGLAATSFSVDDGNQNLKAEGPLLLSKDGKELYECASGCEGAVSVPDGVESIDYGAFADCPQVTDITLPKSVTHVGASAFRRAYDSQTGDLTYTVVLHVTPGSTAERMAITSGIPYRNET